MLESAVIRVHRILQRNRKTHEMEVQRKNKKRIQCYECYLGDFVVVEALVCINPV